MIVCILLTNISNLLAQEHNQIEKIEQNEMEKQHKGETERDEAMEASLVCKGQKTMQDL